MRTFKVPQINLSAHTYHEMIDWTSESKRHSPPILCMIPDATICELAKENSQHDLVEYMQYPCHSQSVERGVKKTTEAAASVCGGARRNAVVQTNILSRMKMQTFDTKKHFRQ